MKKKAKVTKQAKPTQRDVRRGVDVGSGMSQVSPVGYWYKHGHFANEDEARGAFRLAYQQYKDGMGASAEAWMGITSEEFDAWMREDALPAKGVKKGAR